MSEGNMDHVTQPVTILPRGKDRDQRVSRTKHVVRSRPSRLLRSNQARRRLNSPRGGGRAWINGREVGGTDPRYAHLLGSYD